MTKLCKSPSFLVLIWLCSFMLITFSYVACTSSENEDAAALPAQLREGKKLADQYCGACHLPVSPNMLNREIWTDRVLPKMAPKLGIGVWKENQYYPAGSPGQQTSVSFAEWMKIVNYFEQQAPEALPPAEPPAALIKDQKSFFSVEMPSVADSTTPTAATTMVKIDPRSGTIYTSDANENALLKWDSEFNATSVFAMNSPAVDLNFIADSAGSRAVLTTIGTMLAEDISRGIVQYVSLEGDTGGVDKQIDTELTRPLQARSADFNKDGLQDWIICVFGHETGGLYLYQQQADGSYQRKTVRGVPGAEDVEIRDFNGDGWPDLMVLFAYDDEGIWLFTNDQQGGFKTENVLRFPPVFGSTSFELADMNGDGRTDIILTNGDNADFSPILKPYHGLRVYLNKGENRYEEGYFYPINGTFKAIVEDFDLDGDKDIATISFFADLESKPEESFILFESTGQESLSFNPVAVPVHQYGRWLSMDAGDIDGDGDIDLALGNFSRQFIGDVDFNPKWNTKVPFILLRNNTR